MVKSPAFQFYYKEWITGTIHMSRTERDIYLLLLIASYDKDGLVDDENELQRIALCKNKAERDAVAYIISKKFHKDNGGLYRNNKMEDVRANQKSFKASKSESGKNGAEKRWQKNGTAILSPLANDSSTTTTTTTTAIIPFKPENHFEHMKSFYSKPFDDHEPGFKSEYPKDDYERFSKLLLKLLSDIPEVSQRWNKCMNIGEWIKHLDRKPYMVIKQSVEKAMGYKIDPATGMVFKIKQFLPEHEKEQFLSR